MTKDLVWQHLSLLLLTWHVLPKEIWSAVIQLRSRDFLLYKHNGIFMNLFWIHFNDMPSALKIFMRGSRGVLGKPLEFHAAVYEEEGGGVAYKLFITIFNICQKFFLKSWKGQRFLENNGISIFWYILVIRTSTQCILHA